MQYDTKAWFYTIKNGEITNFILQQKWAWMCIKSTIQQLNSEFNKKPFDSKAIYQMLFPHTYL
jgi:hypothetical protein